MNRTDRPARDRPRATCEACAAIQPAAWQPGERCGACGGAVRREVRCAWCARLTPAARFCRACGCETVDDARYGAARMLKAGGVDRFALVARLAALDAELVAHLTARYAQQRAVVARRVDEVALCERALVAGGHAARLEDELLAQLPLDEAALAALGDGPQGPFDDPARLPAIAAHSPRAATRTLAALALLRTGALDEAHGAAAIAALADDGPLATEAALALAHWRVLAAPWAARIPAARLAACAAPALHDPRTRGWAAVACARGGQRDEPIELALRDHADDADRDLRHACAFARVDPGRLIAALDRDPALRALALPVIARRDPAAIGPWLDQGDDADRAAILSALPRPAPAGLGAALVGCVERGGPRVRALAAGRLGGALTAALTARAIAAVIAHADPAAAAAILRARPLPGAEAAVRALVAAALPLGPLAAALDGLATDALIAPATAIMLLEEAGDELRRAALVRLAERVLVATGEPALARALTRVGLGPHPVAIRSAAIWALLRAEKRRPGVDGFALTPASIAAHFADAPTAARALTAVLTDDPTLRAVGVYDWLTDRLRAVDPALAPLLARDPPTHAALLDALVAVIARDYWVYLRAGAAAALGVLAAASPHAARLADALDQIRATAPPYDIVWQLERSAAHLRAAAPGNLPHAPDDDLATKNLS